MLAPGPRVGHPAGAESFTGCGHTLDSVEALDQLRSGLAVEHLGLERVHALGDDRLRFTNPLEHVFDIRGGV